MKHFADDINGVAQVLFCSQLVLVLPEQEGSLITGNGFFYGKIIKECLCLLIRKANQHAVFFDFRK